MEASLINGGTAVGVGLLLGILWLFLVAKTQRRKRTAVDRLAPGPRNWPIVGALFEMEADMKTAFDKLARKYGPLVYFRLGIQDVILVSGCDAARELLRDKDLRFTNRGTMLTNTAAKYTGFDGANFVFADYNEQLKETRKVCYSELFCRPKMDEKEQIRSREVAAMVEKISKTINESKSDKPISVDMRSEILHLNANVIYEYVFGRSQDSLPDKDLRRQAVPLLENFSSLFMALPLSDLFPFLKWVDQFGTLKKFQNYGEKQDKFFLTVLENYRKQRAVRKAGEDVVDKESANLIDALLDFQDSGGAMTDNGIMAAISALIVGGLDTSTSVVEWTLLELVRHPKLLKRLQVEVDNVAGKERMVKEADVASMPFLNAAVTESMRLHPALNFTGAHVNRTPETLGGYHIPAKTAVFVNIYSLGRDPKIWENPLEFNPERFLPGAASYDPAYINDTSKVHGGNYNLLPFSAGRRSCLGYKLGITMVLMAVASIVHAFELSPEPGTAAEDMSNEGERGSIVSVPAASLKLVLKSRLPSNVYNSGLL